MVKKLIFAACTLFAFTLTPVQQASSGIIDDLPQADAIDCLAKNIYYEARSESFAGQISVGMVVLNRVNDSRFPGTVCDVVYQGKFGTNQNVTETRVRRGMCQFSWACDGLSDKPKNQKLWIKSLQTAEIVYRMYKSGFDITNGATHYHALYVEPTWSKSRTMKPTGKIDSHVFYKWEIRS